MAKILARTFEDNSDLGHRGLQAYPVLVGYAANSRLITYKTLSEVMHYGNARVLNKPLGCIMGWCKLNNLPALTAVVVTTKDGQPGPGLTTMEGKNWPAAIHSVFQFDWFSIVPPTHEELKKAGRLASTGALDAE